MEGGGMRALALMGESGLWLFSAALNGAVLFRLWARLLPVRPGRLWRALWFLTLSVTSITVIWVGDPNMLYALPVFFVLGLLCSQGSWAGRLALTAIFFSLIISVSAVLDTYLEFLGTQGLLNQLLRAAWYGGLYLALRRRLPARPPALSLRLWKLVLGLAAMPLCALVAVVLLTCRSYESAAVHAVGLNQGLVVLPLALFTSVMLLLAISILADHEQLERSAQLAGLREAYYQSLRSQQTQLRRLRHDLRSHLAVLGGLMEGERWKAARAYLKELGESPALAGSRRLCENETANAVLSAKTEEMEREGIRPELDLALPARLPFADTDLAALLGNALDNALEGCRGAAEKKIRVRCKAGKGLLMLQVRNTMGGEVRPGFATTKPDPAGHGLGLPGMREIAERYRGTLEARAGAGEFELTVCLPLEGPPAGP